MPISVTEHGASGDGESLDTAPIQAAIDACADAGGGTVHVPAGEYRVGTLELRSDIRLHLDPGAVLRGSEDPADYRAVDGGLRALVVAVDATNVSVSGTGTIDGNASAFMEMDRLLDPGEDPGVETTSHEARQGDSFLDPSGGIADGPVTPHETRPDRLLLLKRCSGVSLAGVRIRESPNWTVHLLGCDGVHVRGLDVRTDLRIPNSDGINPDCSRNVHISDCTVVTGDDAVCLKTSREFGVEAPLENVVLTNCVLVSRSCAIKLGSSTEYDIRHCLFSNVVIRRSNRGLGIQHRDAGAIADILFTDVTIQTRFHSGNWWGMAEPVYVTSVPRTDGSELGSVRDVRFANVRANGQGGIVLYGHESGTLRGVSLDEVHLTVTSGPKSARKGGNIDLRPTTATTPIFERDVPGVFAHCVAGLNLSGVSVTWSDPPGFTSHAVECERCRRIRIDRFEGRGAHGSSAIALRRSRDLAVQNSRAVPGTETFLSLTDTADERRFAGNDLVEATTPIDGEPSFTSSFDPVS